MRCNILILFNKKVRRNLTFNVVSILFNEVVLSSILKIHIHIYIQNCKYSFNSYRG